MSITKYFYKALLQMVSTNKQQNKKNKVQHKDLLLFIRVEEI